MHVSRITIKDTPQAVGFGRDSSPSLAERGLGGEAPTPQAVGFGQGSSPSLWERGLGGEAPSPQAVGFGRDSSPSLWERGLGGEAPSPQTVGFGQGSSPSLAERGLGGEAISPYIFPGLASTDKLQHILRMCCSVAGVERELVLSDSRLRSVVLARQLYCWFARRLTTHRLKEIGEVVNVSHATVIHHLKTAKNHLQVKDPEFMKAYNRIA